MANINLLTPTSIYGRTVHFQTLSGTVTGAPLKSYIATAVPAGKTQFITGLSWQFTNNNYTNIDSNAGVRIYKRLPNSTDLFIINSTTRSMDLTTQTAIYGDYEIFSKSSGFYLQEGEALIIEVVPAGNIVAVSVKGYMTYLEIE